MRKRSGTRSRASRRSPRSKPPGTPWAPSSPLGRTRAFRPRPPQRNKLDAGCLQVVCARMHDSSVGDILVQRDELEHRVKELAAEISRDYADRELLLIGVLKGAVFFLSDLMRHLDVTCEVDFMAVSSYGASTDSSGVVR